MTSGSFGSASHAYGSVTVSPWCVRSVGTCLAVGGVGADEDSGDGTVLMIAKSKPCHQNHSFPRGGDPRTPRSARAGPDAKPRSYRAALRGQELSSVSIRRMTLEGRA